MPTMTGILGETPPGRVGRLWDGIPREAMAIPSLKVLKDELGAFWSVKVSCPQQGLEQNDVPNPTLPSQTSLNFQAQPKQEEGQILQCSSCLEELLGKEGVQRGTCTLTQAQGLCRYRCVNVSPAQSCACSQLQILQGGLKGTTQQSSGFW